jgi:hypothetical protein
LGLWKRRGNAGVFFFRGPIPQSMNYADAQLA